MLKVYEVRLTTSIPLNDGSVEREVATQLFDSFDCAVTYAQNHASEVTDCNVAPKLVAISVPLS